MLLNMEDTDLVVNCHGDERYCVYLVGPNRERYRLTASELLKDRLCWKVCVPEEFC